MNFIKGLGTLLRVRDCDPVMTYMGGLDLRDSDGPFAYAWHEEFMQGTFLILLKIICFVKCVCNKVEFSSISKTNKLTDYNVKFD